MYGPYQGVVGVVRTLTDLLLLLDTDRIPFVDGMVMGDGRRFSQRPSKRLHSLMVYMEILPSDVCLSLVLSSVVVLLM